jgi:hypothetical protein
MHTSIVVIFYPIFNTYLDQSVRMNMMSMVGRYVEKAMLNRTQ